MFMSNDMVLVYQYHDINNLEWDSLRLACDQKNLKLKVIPNKLATKALEDTKYRNISNLFHGPTLLAYGEPQFISNLFKIVKSTDKLLLVGGVFEDELMTPKMLAEMSKLPEKSVVLQQLLGTIKGPHTQLSRLVQNGSTKLSQLLTQWVQQEGE